MIINKSSWKIFTIVLTSILLPACNLPQNQPVLEMVQETAIQTPDLPKSGVPTLEPTLATLQLAVYPPETRSGDPRLDSIIDAVLTHDVEALRNLTRYTTLGCTHADGLGGPPKCESGEEEGTLVNVVPFLGPEGHHQRQEEYQSWMGPDVLGLLAAYRVSSEAYSDEFYPAGAYALVFLDHSGSAYVTLQVRDGGIVRFDFRYAESLQIDLERNAAEIILPLEQNPIPTQVPWSRFDDPQGRFAFVYPPTMTISKEPGEQTWRMGDQIEIEIHQPGISWVTCFDQALGDCPVVEQDEQIEINGMRVRRVKGWFGAVGGFTPQEFLTYIFDMDGQQVIFTIYALPFNTNFEGISKIWPLEGMELELFERTVQTVVLQ